MVLIESRGESDSVCVCVIALKHQLMNLMNRNLTQVLDDASRSSLNSHTYSQRGYVHCRTHLSRPDSIIQNQNAWGEMDPITA